MPEYPSHQREGENSSTSTRKRSFCHAGGNCLVLVNSGILDITSGLAVPTLMFASDNRTIGLVLLVFALIPFGDMSNIFASNGRRSTAFSVHGATCLVMLVAGLILLHAI